MEMTTAEDYRQCQSKSILGCSTHHGSFRFLLLLFRRCFKTLSLGNGKQEAEEEEALPAPRDSIHERVAAGSSCTVSGVGFGGVD